MHVLSRKDDPTGFLNLFRLASMDRFGDPRGFIQGQGRQPNYTKAGPGRRRTGPWNLCRKGSKVLRAHGMRRGH